MKSFKQYIREGNDVSFVHDDAIIMNLRDFIDALELLDDRKTDEDRLVEIRGDCPEPGTLTLRLMIRDPEDTTED